ncbi:MAG: tRNA pseudouridine(13) synthase TruD [Phycisphaeraceae bacterium]|nr:tRNA pseudouridine(13) synthase TruD [Phycisphaeraceae bacterium]
MTLPEFSPSAQAKVYLTAEVPPVGGVLRARPEDFVVDELPAYEPTGSGEHIMLLVEKRGLATSDLIGALAKHFGVRRESIGYAGLKDKQAVTRQHVTVHVPGKSAADFPAFEHPSITVLWAEMHANKIRRGHLAGNHFVIRVRGVDPGLVVRAFASMRLLAAQGVPNRTGIQRFGALANNHLVGRAAILGEYRHALDVMLGPDDAAVRLALEARQLYAQRRYDEARHAWPRRYGAERRALASLAKGTGPKRAFESIETLQRTFFFTAFQSAVFNSVLDRRIADGTLGRLVPGDIAFKHDNGAAFAVDAAVAADPETVRRVARLEISPSGPMWGPGLMRATGEVGAVEERALGDAGVSPEAIDAYAEGDEHLEGSRRPLRVPLRHPDIESGVDDHGSYIKCVFELPRGAFATVVMDEIMKPKPAQAGSDHAVDEDMENEE